MNIGDIFLRLLADDKGFAVDVDKKAQVAGDKAGRTLGQRMAAGLKANVGTAIGASAGLLFGAAAKGASDLEEALGNFRAETGATQEELNSARSSAIELSRTNLQGFDEILATQAKLRTDLGLTQEQAEANTDSFLKYGTATGRDAAEGVSALDDILDAWNLDASKSGEIMDKLVASHQEYGGSITENEAALSKLAPQLSALNLDIDDGIGLLNLFAASGLDASKGQFALNSAIQKLPEGESLDQFIARLSTVEDDGERARLAIEVFGARGGAGLANAIRPGVDSLDDFKVSTQEATGAVNEAADAIESTPLNWLKLQFKNLIAPAVEFGGSLGPIILAFSQLGGGKLVAGVATALGGLAGSLGGKLPGLLKGFPAKLAALIVPANVLSGPLETALAEGLTDAPKSGKVKAAAGKLGKFLGSGLGKVAAAAFSAFLVFEVVETYNRVKGELAGQLEEIGQGIAKQIATGTTEELERSRTATAEALSKLMSMPDLGIISGDAKDQLKKELEAINAELERRASGLGPTTGNALASGEGAVTDGAEDMLSGIVPELDDTAAAAGKAAQQTPQEIADGIRSKRDAVDQAMSALTDAMENEMTRAQERVKVIAALTGEDLAKGLKSKDPVVRAQADATREILEGRLRELANRSGEHGRKTGDLLVKGLKSKDPDVRAAAVRTRGILEEQFRNSQRAASRYGWNTADAYADGIRSGYTKVKNAAIYLVQGAKEVLRAYSPPGPDSPLHDIDVWGEKTGTAWADGMVAAITGSTRRIRGAVGATSAAFGLTPPTSALAAPSVARMSVPDAMLGDVSAAGGDTYNIPVNVQGALPVETIRDIQSGIRRVGEAGLLPKRTAPAQYPIRRG